MSEPVGELSRRVGNWVRARRDLRQATARAELAARADVVLREMRTRVLPGEMPTPVPLASLRTGSVVQDLRNRLEPGTPASERRVGRRVEVSQAQIDTLIRANADQGTAAEKAIDEATERLAGLSRRNGSSPATGRRVPTRREVATAVERADRWSAAVAPLERAARRVEGDHRVLTDAARSSARGGEVAFTLNDRVRRAGPGHVVEALRTANRDGLAGIKSAITARSGAAVGARMTARNLKMQRADARAGRRGRSRRADARRSEPKRERAS